MSSDSSRRSRERRLPDSRFSLGERHEDDELILHVLVDGYAFVDNLDEIPNAVDAQSFSSRICRRNFHFDIPPHSNPIINEAVPMFSNSELTFL